MIPQHQRNSYYNCATPKKHSFGNKRHSGQKRNEVCRETLLPTGALQIIEGETCQIYHHSYHRLSGDEELHISWLSTSTQHKSQAITEFGKHIFTSEIPKLKVLEKQDPGAKIFYTSAFDSNKSSLCPFSIDKPNQLKAQQLFAEIH